jgi:hypothetical protein
MRVLLKALMDVEAGNEAIKSGAMSEALGKLMDELQPEAAYFVADGGKRAAYVVFDLKELSQIPSVVEPLFHVVNASVEIQPAMNVDDLQAGIQQWARQS